MTIAFIEPRWPAPSNVRAYSTLRGGGASGGIYRSLNVGDHVGDDPALVMENRRRVRIGLNLPAEPVWLRQVHGTGVADLDAAPGAPDDAADAAITRRPGVVCAIMTADCLPVLLSDIDGSAVGAAHAGWRGLAAGVLEATVAALGIEPQRLLAWLGPAIGPQAFEVGAEVRDAFVRRDSRAACAFVPSPQGRHLGRYLGDLTLLARQRLESLGVVRIHEAAECTYSNPQMYFSHRRDGRTGRHATLIWKT